MRHQYGPHAWPHLSWRIPLMAMAHSIHGHGPIPFMAIALLYSWPRPSFMAKALSLAHHITAPGKTSPYIRCRTARALPPRRFRANRLNPGIKSYWRWGWFRGVATVDRGDHRTLYIRICIGHKWGYARIYRGKNGHICAYLWAMNARIYGSSNGHECVYLWQQQWPCMRVSMAAAMAMYAHIHGP